MATISQEVIRKFQKRVNGTLTNYRELLIALHGKKRQASLEAMLAEQFVLNTAVLLEVFLNDLFIAYVAEDASAYLRGLRERVAQSMRDKFGVEAAKYMQLNLPTSLPVLRVGAWLDPKEFNITAGSADTLANKANATLAAQHAKKFTLEKEAREFVDFALVLRNYLAHRSDSARRNLRHSIGSLGGSNSDFAGSFHDVSVYLKHRNTTGESRAALFATKVVAIAAEFN